MDGEQLEFPFPIKPGSYESSKDANPNSPSKPKELKDE